MDETVKQGSNSGILWLLILLFVTVQSIDILLPGSIPITIDSFLNIGLPFVFAMIHGWKRYGAKNMMFFLISCLVISNIYENLSILTGFPFGHYYYSDNFGPKIFLVPFLIGIAYFANGYLAWTLAHVLLGNLTPSLRKANIFLVPLIASFLMVSWDFTADPDASTVSGDWVWLQGGGYFGVPFTNFLGWFLCVYTYYQVFALYISRQADLEKLPVPNKVYWYQTTLFYFFTGFATVLNRFFVTGRTITDPSGKSWSTADMYDTLALAAIFTMIFTSILGFIKINQDEKILP